MIIPEYLVWPVWISVFVERTVQHNDDVLALGEQGVRESTEWTDAKNVLVTEYILRRSTNR